MKERTEFVELVWRMRAAQAAYFETRDGLNLSLAKELERRVDAEVERITNAQPRLFTDND